MKLKNIFATALVLSMIVGAGAFAQQAPGMGDDGMPGMQQEVPDVDLEDGELERFAEALVDVQFIQQDAQVEVQDAIDASDLTLERFQEIHQSNLSPEMGEADVDDSEQVAYDDAMQIIEDIEVSAADEMEDAVADHGLDVERFNTLAQAIPQDPELSQELNEIAQQIMQERGDF